MRTEVAENVQYQPNGPVQNPRGPFDGLGPNGWTRWDEEQIRCH